MSEFSRQCRRSKFAGRCRVNESRFKDNISNGLHRKAFELFPSRIWATASFGLYPVPAAVNDNGLELMRRSDELFTGADHRLALQILHCIFGLAHQGGVQ